MVGGQGHCGQPLTPSRSVWWLVKVLVVSLSPRHEESNDCADHKVVFVEGHVVKAWQQHNNILNQEKDDIPFFKPFLP